MIFNVHIRAKLQQHWFSSMVKQMVIYGKGSQTRELSTQQQNERTLLRFYLNIAQAIYRPANPLCEWVSFINTSANAKHACLFFVLLVRFVAYSFWTIRTGYCAIVGQILAPALLCNLSFESPKSIIFSANSCLGCCVCWTIAGSSKDFSCVQDHIFWLITITDFFQQRHSRHHQVIM